MFNNSKPFGCLLRLIWKYDKVYTCMLPLIIVTKVWKDILFMIFPALIIDAMIERDNNLAFFYALLMGFVFLAGSLISQKVEKYNQKKVMQGKEWLGLSLQKRLIEAKYSELENSQFMDEYQKALSVCTMWQADFRRGIDVIIQLAANIVTIIMVTWLLVSLEWMIAVIVGASVILSSVFNVLAVKNMSKLLMECAPTIRKTGYFLGELQDRKYAKEIRVYHMQEWIKGYAGQLLHSVLNKTMRAINKQISIESISITMGALQEGGAYLYIGWLALMRKITLGGVTMYISAINNFANAMKKAMECVVVLKEVEIYYKKFWEVVYAERNKSEALNSNQCAEDDMKLLNHISVEFEHVWFKYNDNMPWILKDVSLKIEDGERISLVGDNGAGKTTFVKLLLGLLEPTKGSIRINGKNLKEYDLSAYWKKMGVVFQDYKVLNFTIWENIVLGNEKGNREQIITALQQSGLWEKIEKYDAKENTYIGKEYYENGIELSGGEKQKVAIAQLQYKNAPMMILDEPTANLSPMEEYRIFQQFHNMSQGKTVVFISHRMSSCRLCDRIIVLEKGMVCEQGNHEELMKKNGIYADMFQIQAQYYV